jgi:hypothetical protein
MVKKQFETEDDESSTQDVSEMDLIFETNDRLDALLELLIEKKIISKHELEKKVAEITGIEN